MRCARQVLGLVMGIGLGLPSAMAQVDDDDGWERGSKLQLPMRHITRPLTMPEGVFDVFFDGGATMLSPSLSAVSLGASTRYGITDDAEVGVRLVRVTMSEAPDTGLQRPTAFSTYRTAAGPFEAAGRFEMELPVSPGALQAWVSLPMLLRAGPYLRFDSAPTLSIISEEVWGWSAQIPFEVSGQVTDRLRLFASSELGLPNLRTGNSLLLRVGGGLAWAFGEDAPQVEVVARLDGPSIALAGERSPDPTFGNYVSGGVTVRLFFKGPANDPYSDPF